MRERCLQHGLAVGPDGKCVLCHSRAPEQQSSKLGLVIAAFLLVVAAVVVWKIARSQSDRQFAQVERADTVSESQTSAVAPPLAASPMGVNSSRRTEAETHSQIPTAPTGQYTFSERDPRGLAPQLRARGETDVVGEYLPGKESYELVVPPAAVSGQPHGLLVWISAGASGSLPNPEWKKVLAYFRPLPVHSRPQGGTWPARYGVPSDLALAKSRPVALTTGPNDFNFGQISDVVAGVLEDRFARVQIFSWQDLGHAPPPADALDRALTWLDGRQ